MKALAMVLLACGCTGSVEQGVQPIVGCLRDSDCQYGFYCQAGGCQQSLRTCASDADCLLGEDCRPNQALGCVNPDSGLDCPAKNLCEPADERFCCPCRTAADCLAGAYCVALDAANACTASCTPSGCPTGSSCGDVQGPDGGMFETCLPNGGTCPTDPLCD